MEGLVGIARWNFLVPVPEAASLDELNDRLLQDCLAYGALVVQGQDQTVTARFEAERGNLLPLPRTPFSTLVSLGATADKFATVVIDRNRYSVPMGP